VLCCSVRCVAVGAHDGQVRRQHGGAFKDLVIHQLAASHVCAPRPDGHGLGLVPDGHGEERLPCPRQLSVHVRVLSRQV